MYRVGIVGFGRIAESAHLPAWLSLPDVQVVAIADACPERRAHAAALLPDARVFSHVEAMLAEETIDYLDICTPPADHLASILEGCQRRVPRIVCEKPLTASADEYATIASAQARSGSQVYTINSWLQSDLHRLVTHELAAGTIGAIRSVTLRTLRPDCALGVPSWRPRWRTDPRMAGGGIVLDHGWHQLYLMAHWIGEDPTGVAATMRTEQPRHAPVEDSAVLEIAFPDARGRIELSWAALTRTNDGEIVGSGGRITIHDDRLTVHSARGIVAYPYGERLSDSSYHPEWFRALFAQILGDTSRTLGRQHMHEAGMLTRTLFDAYAAAHTSPALARAHGAIAQ